MSTILSFALGPMGLIFIWAGYKALLKVIINEKNIESLGEAIDKYVDKVQKKNPDAGKETRQRLINTFEGIIENLKEADGVN